MAVKLTKLDNGLTVVTDQMEYLKTTALGVWVKAGSRSEGEHENGITHLLEHMAFKGTTKRNAREIAEEIEAVGGEMNASTSVEHTNYYVRTLADDVPLGLDILSDILQDSIIDADELAREKHVILQEIGAAQDTPDDQIFDILLETAWPKQPLGRPILGTPETVNSFSADAIREYVARKYTASDMVLAAAGAVDHEHLVELANSSFSKLSADAPDLDNTASYVGGEGSIERDLQELQIILGFEGLPYQHEDYYAVQVLASILGGGMSSRLFQEVREKRGLCYSVYAFHWAFADTGFFGVHAATGPNDAAELTDVLVEQLKEIAKGVTEQEVSRAKAQLRAGLLMALESPAARAGQIARQVMIHGHPVALEELERRLNAVSADRLKKLSATLFTSDNPTFVKVGPKAPMLDYTELKARLSGTAA
ncbi:Protease 3 precursor [Pseudovibrio axinellae]|uniref:Protease 3 n=1 Tax=Pseudovibrio axinellae TaxID=989403 RepID=A0A165YE92_9HYPH|nr:pitrilysin family protein [Pseudovibrio axinellae]KZL18766.1 Protease 3 precursor [Pseudovibrio axinellae]SEP93600.1 Predicted Zn-dependent peptidase [Pseudovibrio axinellae]